MKAVFKIDGKEYPGIFVKSLKRSFQVIDGPNAGRLMNYDMVRDVGGTFYNYSMVIDTDMTNQKDYDDFYEKISAPQDSHDLEAPYGQNILNFKAYVTNGEDDLLAMFDDFNKWGNLSINFVAMSPQRRPI